MIWLTWRQHRRQALFAVVGLAVLAAGLVPTGLWMHDTFADTGLAACLRDLGPAETVRTSAVLACDSGAEDFYNAHGGLLLPAVLLVLLPLLVGLFFGAPLVAREVEQGTHRLVWTQGVTRLRWALVKFGLIAAGAVVLAVAYTLLTSWWITPLTHADPMTGRFPFPFFDLYGVAPVGHTLFAVALGVFAGTISRKMLSAMAVTLVAFLGARIAVTVLARPRFQSPLERTFPVATDVAPNRSLGDWILTKGIYDGQGDLVAANTIGICHRSEADVCGGFDRVNVWTYQPGSRFWLFQYLETGLYVALAALLLLLALRQVRRRIS
jgi:hypothetical protein